ncbi:MAG: tetratricopeptide repeat protein [Terriglobales bacterium]
MTQRLRLLFIFLILAGPMPVNAAETDQTQELDRAFQAALSQYNSGNYSQAADRLEELVRQVPQSFDVHELLGMVYAAESQEWKANDHLAKAVRLKPNSVEARTNLATNLVHMGKVATAETEFRKAVELDPGSYDTNHNLGEVYVAAGKLTDAVPYLEKAQKINSAAYDNGYDLALAYAKTGKLDDGRNLIQDLLKQKDTAELHNVLGEIEEKAGKFIAAENQYETAAHMDPSESNLFDWGSELLVHRTLDPAVNVFQSAAEHYPNSPRLAIGLGMALYSRGNYDDAVKALLKAADLNPSDPRCYYFLSKAYDSSPSQANEVIQRFRRFAELQPQNARAHLYYAMSLWKGRRAQDANLDTGRIESLLKGAIALDPKLPEPHLQLGNLYSDQSKYAEAIPHYQRALQENADLADAHYRLGQAYVHTGQKIRAQEELEIYQRLRAQHLAELDKQRAEIRQFVYSEKDAAQH